MATQQHTFVSTDYGDFAVLNTEFANIYAALNGSVAATIANGSITDVKLDDGASSATYFGELFQDSVVIGTTGLAHVSSSGLNETITAGTAYVLKTSSNPDKMVRINITTATTHGVTDNTTNYLDLGADGVIDVVQSSTPAADHIRLLEVVASSGSISGTTDKADRDFLSDTISDFKPKQMDWACTSATAITIQSGSRFRNTTNAKTYEFAANVTVDIENSVGALGLDQGSESSSTWYALVGIGDSSGANAPSAILVDASDYTGSIVVPSGYDQYKRIGWVRNDGSSNLIQGAYWHNRFYYEDEQVAGTGLSSATFAGVSMTSMLPTTERAAHLRVNFSSHTGAPLVFLRTTGNSASTGIEVLGTVNQNNCFTFLTDTSQSIDYKTSADAIEIAVMGYLDDLENDS